MKLNLIADYEGSISEEQRAHRGMSGGRGEWFPRPVAMQLKRSMDRIGTAAIPGFERRHLNIKAEMANRSRLWERAYRLTAIKIAKSALSLFTDAEMKEKTGLTATSWRNAASGRTAPGAHAVLNSLTFAPSHIDNLLRVTVGRRLDWLPVVGVDEAAALETEAQIDAAMEALAALKARCIAIRKERAA